MGLVGYGTVAHSLALSLRNGDPARAHALAPQDGRVAAAFSEKLAGADATPADRVRADAVARDALNRDPTAVDAVGTLGLDAQIRGDQPAARRLFAYAQRLSRRDLRTHLWAVEDAVARGDVTGALKSYDVALRTSRVAPELMFPVLAAAIAEPSVRAGLVRTLAGRTPWSGSFTDYVAGNGPDPRATVALFGDLRRANVPVSAEAQAALIGSLVTRGMIRDAWAYYGAIHPGAVRTASRDPHFRGNGVSPFDWVPVDDPAMSASIQRSGEGGVFDFAAPPSVGGPLLNQIQVLPAGEYVIEGRGAGIDQPEGSRPYWVLTCLSDKRELGRVVLPNSAQANGMFTGRFSVPAGCAVQYLSLVARPSEVVSGVSGQIDRVQLRPAR